MQRGLRVESDSSSTSTFDCSATVFGDWSSTSRSNSALPACSAVGGIRSPHFRSVARSIVAAPSGRAYLLGMTIRLSSERLDLMPFTSEILEAMILGESDELHVQTGARFSGGIAPPLMEDALPHFLDRLRGSAPPEWWGWLAVDRILSEAVGSVGFAGPPDGDGLVLLGYSVYPRYERMGYGTEAAGILVQWALAQPGVTAIRATIPPWNAPSLRVAEKLGMCVCGESTDPEVGKVIVFEIKAKA